MAIEMALVGSVNFLRYTKGVLILGLVLPDDGARVLCYEKTKTALFHYYCLRLGDTVELRAVPAVKGGVCRIKGIVLLGLEPVELSERMDHAQEKYSQVLMEV